MSPNPRKVPPPTLRTVADKAGVSVAVVSYSFSRPDRVAVATRQRVLAVAEEMGYAGPNPAARALRTGKTGVLCFQFDRALGQGLPPRFGVVASAILEACGRRNISLVLPTGTARPAHDGSIVLGPIERDLLDDSPHVLIGPGLPPGDNVVTSGAEGVETAAADFKRHGHRHVAFMGDPGTRLLCEGQAERYGPDARAVVVPSESHATGVEVGQELLGSADRPTAILCVGSPITFGLREAAFRLGLRVPEDLSLVSVDTASSLPHDFSIVSIPLSEIGEAAVRLLLETIDEGSPRPGLVIPNQYRPGKTVGPAPSTA